MKPSSDRVQVSIGIIGKVMRFLGQIGTGYYKKGFSK